MPINHSRFEYVRGLWLRSSYRHGSDDMCIAVMASRLRNVVAWRLARQFWFNHRQRQPVDQGGVVPYSE